MATGELFVYPLSEYPFFVCSFVQAALSYLSVNSINQIFLALTYLIDMLVSKQAWLKVFLYSGGNDGRHNKRNIIPLDRWVPSHLLDMVTQ